MPSAPQDLSGVSLLGSSSTRAANVLKVTAARDSKHQSEVDARIARGPYG
jgi:hypothetical protein